jgi:hypothetical protein
MSRIAVVKVRKEPCYRRQAIESGLLRCGFALVASTKTPQLRKDDWLILWNRKAGVEEAEAEDWERRGGSVIVMENGYLQKVDKAMYAISVGQHNGAGWFPVGTEDRFTKLGFEIKPWREGGEHVLVCAQRGIGSKLMASPPGWAEKMAKELRGLKLLQDPVKIRAHPGNFVAKVPLTADLAKASACAIWSSGSGVRALVEGVPVVSKAPHWICEEAAVSHWIHTDNYVARDNRESALHRMSHGQWHVDEITTGEPFARILEGLK